MTDQISFPPLLDLSPGELEAQKQHLVSEMAHQRERWPRVLRVPPLRLRFVAPAVAVICAAVAAVVFTGALGSSGTPSTHPANNVWSPLSNGTESVSAPPTLANPLPAFAEQTTLADASAELGIPLVLPNTTLVQPADAGPVWVASLHDKAGNPVVTTVAVTFPSRGVIVEYTRPAPSDGSAAHFQAMAQGMVSPGGAQIAQVISLSGGVPAFAVQQNSDETGHNFGEIIFNVGGSEVRVMGHTDRTTLESWPAQFSVSPEVRDEAPPVTPPQHRYDKTAPSRCRLSPRGGGSWCCRSRDDRSGRRSGGLEECDITGRRRRWRRYASSDRLW